MNVPSLFLLLAWWLERPRGIVGTIDLNINQLQYLASHLDPFECRRLVAALHYTTYELPSNLAAAERKVDEEIPCLEHLLHWNVSPLEGKGDTHESIVHRLRQLNRNDLAEWLGKTAFEQIGSDLRMAMNRPFGELGDQETETSYPLIVAEPVAAAEEQEPEVEDPWLQIDTVLMAVLLGLLGVFLTLIGVIVHYRIKSYLSRRKDKEEDESLDEENRANDHRSQLNSDLEGNTTGGSTEYERLIKRRKTFI